VAESAAAAAAAAAEAVQRRPAATIWQCGPQPVVRVAPPGLERRHASRVAAAAAVFVPPSERQSFLYFGACAP